MLIPEDLESFFISWGNRIPQKPLTLITIRDFCGYGLDANEGNVTMIEKYKKLGNVKEFKVVDDFLMDLDCNDMSN